MKAINSFAHAGARIDSALMEDKWYRRAFPNFDTAEVKRQLRRSERQAIKGETLKMVGEIDDTGLMFDVSSDTRPVSMKEKAIRHFNQGVSIAMKERPVTVVRKRDSFTRPVVSVISVRYY